MKPRARRWILWLLPFLVARAFVPTGFMLSAAGGDLSLMFCPSVGPVAQIAALDSGASAHDHTQAHAHSHHGDHAQHGVDASSTDQHSNHFGASDTGVCPFAVVAAACASSDFHLATASLDSSSDLVPAYTAPAEANRPIRADRIRGPPTLLTLG